MLTPVVVQYNFGTGLDAFAQDYCCDYCISSVGGGGAGGASAPPKVLICQKSVKIWAKSMKNVRKKTNSGQTA